MEDRKRIVSGWAWWATYEANRLRGRGILASWIEATVSRATVHGYAPTGLALETRVS